MQITDPVADMLTRIRNANTAKHESVDVPASNLKKAIAKILLDEGYIKSYEIVEDGTQGIIRITLKYLPGKEKAIQGLKRVSKPGLRMYAGAEELPRVQKGLGIAIADETLVEEDVRAGRLMRPFDTSIKTGASYRLVLRDAPGPENGLDAFRACLLSRG